tara:strand:+ start:1311 stop:1616 length:306 start_codon:yes stop_codon:yes gene_type:complete
MDAKTKKLLALAGAGVLAYYFFVHKKKEETVSEFSNIFGKRKRKRRKRKKEIVDAIVIDDYSPALKDCKPPKFYCAALKRCTASEERCVRAIEKKYIKDNY